MSAKITVSYSEEREAQEIVRLFDPRKYHIKRERNNTGKYKKLRIIPKA